MTRRTVTCAMIALLFGVSLVSAQQASRYARELPANLSVTDASGGKPAKLRFVGTRQTFDAQAHDVTVLTPVEGIVLVKMTAGDFVWTSAGQPTYKNTFHHLELKFEVASGSFIAFRIVD